MDEATETVVTPKERTLAEIDLRISGIQAQVDRMDELLERSYDTGGHVTYVVDKKSAAAEIQRLQAARKRVIKDLDPLPKFNWSRPA